MISTLKIDNLLISFYFRLWHQLTLELNRFMILSSAKPYLLGLYENFIIDFEKKMNQLSLVHYLVIAVKTISGKIYLDYTI